MRVDSTALLPTRLGPLVPGAHAPWDARHLDQSAFVVQSYSGQGHSGALGPICLGPVNAAAAGPQQTHSACRTVEAALQTLARVDGIWAGASHHGPTLGDRTGARRAAEDVLDDSARREVERMLVQAREYAAAIERSRRQLQSTMNMVLDLIQIESARPDSGAHVSPG